MAGFMLLQVWREPWVYVQGDCHDVQRCPVSYVGDQVVCEGEPEQPALWWAEYTAPGYMDKTDPVWGETAIIAARECFAMYGDDTDPADRAELASVLWQVRHMPNIVQRPSDKLRHVKQEEK